MNQNKVLTALNQPLNVQLYSLQGVAGPQTYSTLDGLPLGTSDGSSTGQIGVKVVVIGGNLTAVPGGFPIPISDDIIITYVGSTNNIDTVTWFFESNQVAVLQLSYADGGATNDDLITEAAFALA